MAKKLTNIIVILIILLALLLFIIAIIPNFQSSDEILFTFSVTSDSQASKEYDTRLSQQALKWSVNSNILNRMIDEILIQKPKILIFLGDGINGSSNGNIKDMDNQYGYFRGVISRLFDNNTYVFPVPGNHEMNITDPVTGNYLSTIETENAWRRNMGDIIPDPKLWERILKVPFSKSAWSDLDYAQYKDDFFSTDQNKLSYSFDYQGSHFIIINTHAVGQDFHVPLMRLREDIFDARRRGVKHVFIFGHIPAFPYQYNADIKTSGLDVDPVARDEFWQFIEENKASYFSGHQHLFYASQPTGKAYQLIVGPAGGGFKVTGPVRNPDIQKYSWVNVKVYKNGRVHIDAYGFENIEEEIKILKCWDLDEGF